MANTKETLLNALLECIKKLGIEHLIEVEIDGKNGYQKAISNSIESVWEMVFCSEIVGISIAPRRKDKSSLDRNALGAWRNGKINDQNKNTITTNFIPQMSGKIGTVIIDAQKNHLIRFVETAVCAQNGTWKKDPNSSSDEKYILESDMCGRERVLPFIYSKFEQLRELFEDTPIRIISEESSRKWFSMITQNRIPEITSDESERLFAAILAAAMVLSLNIRDEDKIPKEDSDKVDRSIEKYLRTLLNDTDDAVTESQYTGGTDTKGKKNTNIRVMEVNKKNGEVMIEDMVSAFELLRTASNEFGILEAMSKIKRSIGRSFLSAEDVVRALPDDDTDTSGEDWVEIAHHLRDAITEYVVYYRALLESDLLTPGLQPPDLIDVKNEVLDIAVEVYTILGFLEAQLKHELEELMRSEGKIEKEQVQMRIRKTKIDLTIIRGQNNSVEADITNALVEHRVTSNYDIGTI